MDDKILTRIKQLIALATNNSSSEEARTAAVMACRLIVEHRVEIGGSGAGADRARNFDGPPRRGPVGGPDPRREWDPFAAGNPFEDFFGYARDREERQARVDANRRAAYEAVRKQEEEAAAARVAERREREKKQREEKLAAEAKKRDERAKKKEVAEAKKRAEALWRQKQKEASRAAGSPLPEEETAKTDPDSTVGAVSDDPRCAPQKDEDKPFTKGELHWKTYSSRFGSKCIFCGKPISQGAPIYWSLGFGAAHEGCYEDAPNDAVLEPSDPAKAQAQRDMKRDKTGFWWEDRDTRERAYNRYGYRVYFDHAPGKEKKEA